MEEVITWVNTHQWHSYMHDQMQFADVSGDGVIISGGADGELVFRRKQQGDGYLVSTNFNVANPANGYGYPCSRYETAEEMLGQLLLFVYESWAVRHGLQAWCVLASKEGQVRSPSWRMLWWWIPLSYAALFAGLVGSTALQRLLSA